MAAKDPIEIELLDPPIIITKVDVDAILKTGMFTSKPSSARLIVAYSSTNKDMFRLAFGEMGSGSSQVLRPGDLRQMAEVFQALAMKLEQREK